MLSFAIDRGGTFCDVFAELPDGSHCVEKLLSEDPGYADAPREGIRRVLSRYLGRDVSATAVETAHIRSVRMGTTVATNALLERRGARVLLVTTAGHADCLRIGNQTRPAIFDLAMRRPSVLYEDVVEVDERVRLVPAPSSPNHAPPEHDDAAAIAAAPAADDVDLEAALASPSRFFRCRSGDVVEILQRPDLGAVRARLEAAYRAGLRAVAVVFVHSFAYQVHERLVGQLARAVGFEQVSLSCDVLPMRRLVPRGQTAVVDAYLTPLIRDYVRGFSAGFDCLDRLNVSFMMSDGGLCPVASFCGSKAILSGPAGGVVGYALTTYSDSQHDSRPVIGFDMGGTSTDVSRYAGIFEHVFDTTVAGVTIQAPQLDINTVAAGGGSRLTFRSGLLAVGPESAGANPGPVCYRRRGGLLAVTDANAVLGRVLPQHFPAIFGDDHAQPLDVAAAERAMAAMAAAVNAAHKDKPMTVDEVAQGFVDVANEAMCRPIRSLTEAKGHDAGEHILACFGGAGAQHACAIARSLGMRKIFVHRYAGVLSAFGLSLAATVADRQLSSTLVYSDEAATQAAIEGEFAALEAAARLQLGVAGCGDDEGRVQVHRYLNLRYAGSDTALMTLQPRDGRFEVAFEAAYQREFGFLMPERRIHVDDIRVRAELRTGVPASAPRAAAVAVAAAGASPHSHHMSYWPGLGRVETPVYILGDLTCGAVVAGPAIVIDTTSTIVVEPECSAALTERGDVVITVGGAVKRSPAAAAPDSAAAPAAAAVVAADAMREAADPVLLSLFSHRFMSIAEQMGKTLQRTAVSTNIKERLDFSCALFGPDGGLVANAPHLPVHLGAMQDAVRFQVRLLGSSWRKGEVLVSNHPAAGGSHLPDITVITPVYASPVDEPQGPDEQPVFYVASRGHHADIGGITPGSMPPFSRSLKDEGAAILSFKLVRGGRFQEDAVRELFCDSRNLGDNISDLRAQVAANQKGVTLVGDVIGHYSLAVVQAYMLHVQRNAESAVRHRLRALHAEYGMRRGQTLRACDYMDDGSCVRLAITIDPDVGTAVFDFTGTSPQVAGNINAPRAVTTSAVIYALRCLVNEDIPLNQGCLEGMRIVLPPHSLVSPDDEAAVVGGNVLTSQRVTDVVFAAFRACAAAQGCCNNFTFGCAVFGYYETIAGGGGAGPTWDGESAVQVHMTNTRIGDVEIIEQRYPVIVRRFAVRRGSGGAGQHRGGDGVIREFEFLRSGLTVGILSERRALPPPGGAGGHDAERGVNLHVRARDGRVVNVGGKSEFVVAKHDRVVIHTPGGGGWGAP